MHAHTHMRAHTLKLIQTHSRTSLHAHTNTALSTGTVKVISTSKLSPLLIPALIYSVVYLAHDRIKYDQSLNLVFKHLTSKTSLEKHQVQVKRVKRALISEGLNRLKRRQTIKSIVINNN